jgi:hypothetical protein
MNQKFQILYIKKKKKKKKLKQRARNKKEEEKKKNVIEESHGCSMHPGIRWNEDRTQ